VLITIRGKNYLDNCSHLYPKSKNRFFIVGIKILAPLLLTNWAYILFKTIVNGSYYANISFYCKIIESHWLRQQVEKWRIFFCWRNFFGGYCTSRGEHGTEVVRTASYIEVQDSINTSQYTCTHVHVHIWLYKEYYFKNS
jgi:hypothetical protein